MTLPCLKHASFCAVLLSAAAASGLVRAQTPEAFVFDAGDTFEMPLHVPMAALTSPGMNFVTSEVGTTRLVKGAPYSAEAVSETTQVLMDGNKIQKRAVQRLARDGEGRTRVERLKRDGSVESVMINDVVAGKRYWLQPDRKRVVELALSSFVAPMRMPPIAPPATPAPPGTPAPLAPPAPPVQPAPPSPPPTMTSDEARSWAEEMRRWARDFTARLRVEQTSANDIDGRVIRDDATGRVIIKRARTVDDDAGNMDVDVVRIVEAANDATEGATAAIAAIPPVPLAAGPTGQGVTTALGSREFDRVRADGSRTTWTIAAGKIGNEKPIDVISERWYSPELLLVVSSRYFDPRRGETTYRLTGLKRGEPDPSLFQVPPDYERKPRSRREERGKN
jgi:hypothetical protein